MKLAIAIISIVSALAGCAKTAAPVDQAASAPDASAKGAGGGGHR